MYDLTALGELLIDFTQCGVSPEGNRLFEQNPGGAVANVLACARKFGRKTAFIGKVGRDMHGLFLKQTLQDAGINTDGLVLAEDVFTTLAFVALSESGERTFSFARKPGADTCLTVGELDENILRNTRILHIGSLSLTDEPARSATYKAVELAKAAGALISYDPNYRASLWPSEEAAIAQMRQMLPCADFVKISDEETHLLTGHHDPYEAGQALIEQGVLCATVTLGKDGTLLCTKDRIQHIPGFDATAVDTTGAGDSFWGAFLSKFLESGKAPGEITADDAAEFALWGNATAALCIQKRGAIPAMPEEAAVRTLIQR